MLAIDHFLAHVFLELFKLLFKLIAEVPHLLLVLIMINSNPLEFAFELIVEFFKRRASLLNSLEYFLLLVISNV